MGASLARFLKALDGLDVGQLDEPADVAGWTVRDHLVRLAVWAEGIAALLRRDDRWAAMGLVMDNPERDDLAPRQRRGRGRVGRAV
ncbi:MAG TPA: maleylpyruvate isomerase N-terminal domain-containing protein [Chloroflexaceae bacterium]|nr:maleylpyruvate isomerase N-terminal domain-containing protein [Chloroflexaceae bacterium]